MADWNLSPIANRLIGKQLSELETPCLCLDLNHFESNLDQISAATSAAAKSWRPHAKCHKTPEIALQSIRKGAIGITCSKVSEAEVFAASGISDILIAHLPVGPRRINRLVNLGRMATPVVTCDHYVQAASLSAECVQNRVSCRALVEINLGLDRTGVRPGRDTIELARGIQQLPGLKLAGLTGNDGHVKSITNEEARHRAIDSAFGILSHAKDLLLKNGLCCDIVSAGGSASVPQSLQCEALTEIQAGAIVFGDPYYTERDKHQTYRPALSILSTVVSRSAYNRAVLDAGRAAISTEYHSPTLQGWDDARVSWLSEEHLVLELGPESREIRIGDQVQINVGYSGLTTMLHDQIICLRNDQVESVWPILARGKLV